MHSSDIDKIKNSLKTVEDFPKPGITFLDIFPIFKSPDLTEILITHLTHHILSALPTASPVHVIVGLDARGFLFGPLVAMRLGASFVPVRKKGKLPGEVVTVEYAKEYGVDVFEMQQDSIQPGQNVVIMDDLLGKYYSSPSLLINMTI